MTTACCTSENYSWESSADGLMRDFPVTGLLSKNTIKASNRSTQVWANLPTSFPLQLYLYCIEKYILPTLTHLLLPKNYKFSRRPANYLWNPDLKDFNAIFVYI